MQEYVLGFLFSEDKQQVALIYKNRPISLKNQWNGIGGHIEENETANKAVIREFYEETGVQIETWNDPFCVVQNKNFILYAFHAFSDLIHNVKSMTDESIDIFDVYELNGVISFAPLVKTLIHLALDTNIEYPVMLYAKE